MVVCDGRGVLGVSPSVRIRTGPSCDYFEQRRLRQAHSSKHIHCSYTESLNQFESDKQYTQVFRIYLSSDPFAFRQIHTVADYWLVLLLSPCHCPVE